LLSVRIGSVGVGLSSCMLKEDCRREPILRQDRCDRPASLFRRHESI